jgi:hypothetical protein
MWGLVVAGGVFGAIVGRSMAEVVTQARVDADVVSDPGPTPPVVSSDAADGDIGSIDQATYEAGSSFMVVDTAPWIPKNKVLIPAGAVRTSDLDRRRVLLGLTKDQIQRSPSFAPPQSPDRRFLERVGSYFGPYIERAG